jgi:hypothetical protein
MGYLPRHAVPVVVSPTPAHVWAIHELAESIVRNRRLEVDPQSELATVIMETVDILRGRHSRRSLRMLRSLLHDSIRDRSMGVFAGYLFPVMPIDIDAEAVAQCPDCSDMFAPGRVLLCSRGLVVGYAAIMAEPGYPIDIHRDGVLCPYIFELASTPA